MAYTTKNLEELLEEGNQIKKAREKNPALAEKIRTALNDVFGQDCREKQFIEGFSLARKIDSETKYDIEILGEERFPSPLGHYQDRFGISSYLAVQQVLTNNGGISKRNYGLAVQVLPLAGKTNVAGRKSVINLSPEGYTETPNHILKDLRKFLFEYWDRENRGIYVVTQRKNNPDDETMLIRPDYSHEEVPFSMQDEKQIHKEIVANKTELLDIIRKEFFNEYRRKVGSIGGQRKR